MFPEPGIVFPDPGIAFQERGIVLPNCGIVFPGPDIVFLEPDIALPHAFHHVFGASCDIPAQESALFSPKTPQIAQRAVPYPLYGVYFGQNQS